MNQPQLTGNQAETKPPEPELESTMTITAALKNTDRMPKANTLGTRLTG
jgi:hypothetical protein